MTIGLFFEIAERTAGRRLLKELIAADLPVRAYEVGEHWDSLDGTEYKAAFEEIGQIVVLIGSRTLYEQWFALLAGVRLGSDRELHLYEGNIPRSPEYPHYLSGAHHARSSRELTDALCSVHTYQVLQRQVSEAREQLVSIGYSLNENAFTAAVAEGNLEAVDLFLRTGMSPDSVNSEGLPVLTTAVRNHREAAANMLVERGADVNVTSADRNNTPLMEAAGRGMNTLVELLLNRNAEVNLQSDNGQTALMLAVAEGFEDTALLLLRNGADPHIKDKLGMSARKYAELYGYARVVEEINKLPGQS